MSIIDGLQIPNPLMPGKPGPKKPVQEQSSPPASQGAPDGANLSPEAKKKKEPNGERKGLLDALKTNFAGNDRISTKESKLDELSNDQLTSVKKKREFDKALTKHEEDHHHVAADLARSGPLYETEIGEDGAEYRKSGKVMIDTGTEEDDDRTVKKMRQVRAAALAPDGNQLAPLSEQDKKVAAEATEKEQKAQSRINGAGKESGGKETGGPKAKESGQANS